MSMFGYTTLGFGSGGFRGPSPNYYGDESDGDVVISTNTDWATSSGVNDTGVVIKNFGSLTIDAGVTVKPANRAKIMMIYCQTQLGPSLVMVMGCSQ